MQLRYSAVLLVLWSMTVDASLVMATTLSSFPDLVSTSAVDMVIDQSGKQPVSPQRMPAHAITLARRDSTTSSFSDLVPSTTVDLATDSTYTTQNVSPARDATSSVTLAAASTNTAASKTTIAAESWQGTSSFPNLVPTTTVNMATDTAGTRTISELREATGTASAGAASASDSSDGKKQSGAVPALRMPGRWAWKLAANVVFGMG
ncbi:hypothetical protein LTR85_010203 [Meristemomyces frigidus]|nr:hypothetical protein LTR85_010203 [Meristemomyces frigidus]